MINVDFLNVTAISDRNVNRSTGVERVVEYRVHPFICVNLNQPINLESSKSDLDETNIENQVNQEVSGL
jgi:hypothetical protein